MLKAEPSVDGNRKFASAIMKNGKMALNKCLSAERLLLLNIEIETRFSVDPTSHLCVVLHFLIFVYSY